MRRYFGKMERLTDFGDMRSTQVQHLRTLIAALVAVFCIPSAVSTAQTEDDSGDLALITPVAAIGNAPIGLDDNVGFSLRLVHSVRFELSADRCYYQFFVDAHGSSPLAEIRMVLDLSAKGQIVGKTQATVQNLDGRHLSKRIREFAFDGPCDLDGVRLVEAMGDYTPTGANYLVPVDLLERDAISTLDFKPLTVALGVTASLPGAAPVATVASAVTGQLEKSCVVRTSNLRTGPGTEFNIVTILQPGLSVFTEKQTGDGKWHKVRTQYGRRGWVYFTLLSGCPG